MLLNHAFRWANFDHDDGSAIIQQGVIHVDLGTSLMRGWFRAESRLPSLTKGSLWLVGNVEFAGLIVVISSGELCLWRHEFTSDAREADAADQWRPEEHRPKPVPVDLGELKRLLARQLGGAGDDGASVAFTMEGGIRQPAR